MTADVGASELPHVTPVENPSKGIKEHVKDTAQKIAEKSRLNTAKDTLKSWVGKKDTAPAAETPIFTEKELEEQIPFTDVQEAAAFLENRSILQKSMSIIKDVGYRLHDAMPAFVVGGGVFAINNLSNGALSSEAAQLITTAFVGSMLAVNGSEIRKSLTHFNGKEIARGAGLALVLTKGLSLARVPYAEQFGPYIDDAFPLLKLLPFLSMFPGGVK